MKISTHLLHRTHLAGAHRASDDSPVNPLDPHHRVVVMRALHAIPDLLGELDTTMSRSDAIAPRYSGGRAPLGSRQPMLPYNKGAADARAQLVSALAKATGRVADVLARPTPRRTTDQLAFLTANLPVLEADSSVLECVGDILRAVRGAYVAIDRPQDHRVIGRCPCGAALYAADGSDVLNCDQCERVHSVPAMRSAALGRATDKLATAAQLARLLPSIAGANVTAERIRQWAARGKLPAHRVGGQTLYRVGDVLAIADGRR
ncbi:helix-turn-helix domain-containing protein [Nocardia sp. NPDC056100]|uniref:helix-turn-helix domain-containing protein n=1 Tax=Nocardia sp. NPDC056100 TaxID=3345712 RepID=UPI0035D60CAE